MVDLILVLSNYSVGLRVQKGVFVPSFPFSIKWGVLYRLMEVPFNELAIKDSTTDAIFIYFRAFLCIFIFWLLIRIYIETQNFENGFQNIFLLKRKLISPVSVWRASENAMLFLKWLVSRKIAGLHQVKGVFYFRSFVSFLFK